MPTKREAIERLHTSMDGVPLPDPNGPPWLASIEVCEEIVTDFLQETLRRIQPGEGGGAKLAAYVMPTAERLNTLFLGYEPDETRDDYARTIWHTPRQLGEHMGMAMQISGETHKAVRDAFVVTAAQVKELAVAKAGHPMSDWGWQLDGLREQLVYALVGVPYSGDPSGTDDDEAPEA